ncbi:c-type cytochrome [Phragmitibacter flavus]|uniref:C-type cytochrome n=2 Tax=Phragmitibacter flavus TaxID=2576071 RepID=A0A5R8KKB6_9BACT|nr:c-type cytochrome [Phragmitibacter flavus]
MESQERLACSLFLTLMRRLILPALVGFLSVSSGMAADATPQWIWPQKVGKEKEVALFRKTFTLDKVGDAKLYATADNQVAVFVNGKKAAESKAWESPAMVDLKPFLIPGENLIAVRAENEDSGAAGLLVKVDFAEEGKADVVTDESWKVSAKGGKDWNTSAAFDDKDWAKPVAIAPLGGGPWANKVNAKMLEVLGNLKAPEATAVADIKLKEGFKVELLHSVNMQEKGSWVVCCFDDKGRMIVSDQYGKLYRVTPPALDGKAEETKIDEIPVELGEAQGLCWAFDALYVVTNSSKYPRGLYRVTDTNNDDTLDKVETLRLFPNTGGEHGPHAVLLGPDGESLYVVVGNQTAVTELNTSRVPQHWAEDNLLEPPLIGRGFMREVMAPGGWIAKTDKDGKSWELIASGFRNQYDAAFNLRGHLFTYDADMEWDFSVPWYRPTRVNDVASGGEFGWRSLSKKWPVRWEDNLPPVADIGPGSPTGVVFGYGAKFPAKYQDAFFICDWSYGKMYAVHMTPDGGGYKAEFEEFASANPLPLTDLEVSPKDGALYFMIGGRRVQSGLYRITYTGKEDTAPIATEPAATPLHELRAKLEAFHGKQDAKAVETAWPHLGHEDRYIRFAARIAVEHQPLAEWKDKALNETNPRASLTALMALIRSAGDDRTLLNPILTALGKLDLKSLKGVDAETLVRNYQLALSRLGVPDEAMGKQVIARLSPSFPTKEPWLDVDLAEVLIYLGDAECLAKAIAILETAPTQEEQIAHAKSLRLAKAGWTPALRERFFKWVCLRAPTYKGGASFQLFMEDIKRDAMATLTEEEKVALKPILEAKPDVQAPQFSFTARNFVKDWKVADMEPLLAVGLEGDRDYANGRNLFGVTTCFACHRFNNEGGAIGPDLSSVAGKYSPRDLLVHILEPSKEISDQYGQLEVTLLDDNKVYGRIMNLAGDKITLNINMMDPNATQSIDRKMIKSMEESKTSMMPPGLLGTCSDTDILDLLAYLLSRGDKEDPMFK